MQFVIIDIVLYYVLRGFNLTENTNLLKTWCVRYLLVLLKGLPKIPFTRSPIFSAISS